MSTLQSNWSASDVFSPREHEIAQFAARGLTNKEISKRTGITPGTVGHTLRAALLKVGLNRRTQLVQMFPPLEKPEFVTLIPKRERDVMEFVAKGDCNKEIASKLVISEATVKVHLKYVFARIGVRNRTEAAVWWRAHAHGQVKGA
ncbi:LuxR C-terminal-related transcriptional regulator [Azospirillum himalayense]|uniref:LuxR C-terminal-related transcriptional regulator n=1 Tax=Azospirillum himalayense TaxID=654847 RepID=A0ABW0FZD6_9PROT